MDETLQSLLGGGLPPGLLTPQQEAAAEQRARNAGLLNLAFGMLQASRGAPGQRAPSLGQIIGQAGPVGVQAYQQSFDQTLQNALRGMQIQEMQRRRQQEEAGRAAMRRLSERMTGMTPAGALAAPGGQVGPTVERAEMIGQRPQLAPEMLIREAFAEGISPEAQRSLLTAAQLYTKEPKETFRPITETERQQRGLPANVPYQISSSGKVSEVGQGPTVQILPGESQTQAGYAKFGVEQNIGVYNAGQAAIKNVPKINETIRLLQQGDPKTGFGAEVVNNINRVRAAFTGSKKTIQSVSDTELLDSLLGSEVFPQIGALGIGAKGLDTPAEREFLRKVMTGTITMNKETLVRMAELRKKYETRSVNNYNEAVERGQLDDLFKFSRLPKQKLQLPIEVNF